MPFFIADNMVPDVELPVSPASRCLGIGKLIAG
jgi:hypothetical protein